MKLIFNALKKVEGLKVYETKLPDYLFTNLDPSQFLPEEFKMAARIEHFEGAYTTFLKNSGRIAEFIKKEVYPPGTPGAVLAVVDAPGGKLAVGCVLGRVFMKPFDDPFRAVDALVEPARSRDARYMIIDVHAEASSEKMALGWYLDGRVSAVLGTHTHIPTADERVLPGGTAYISDVGMTGPYDSVIGMEKNAVIAHFVTGLHHKFQPATRDIRFYAVLIDLDEATGRARSIRRIALELGEGESA